MALACNKANIGDPDLDMALAKLSESDKQEICRAMAGLSGRKAAAEARTLADFYGVHPARIYDAARSVRPERKRRSDAGRRKVDLLANPATRAVSELVANQKVSPELATIVVKANPDLFGEMPDVSQATIRRYLRDHGLSRVQAKESSITYRPWEAKFPGEIFQFDISGVKERWMDIRTRRIHKVGVLDVSKNHPNTRTDRVPVWKFTLVDDKSRKKFVRFVACPKANTVHVVDFLREAFLELGLPQKLYTDNDSVIVNKRTMRGASFLNEAFKDSGGFTLIQHTPGSPQATGKVERTHQTIEEYERLIGVKAEFGSAVTIEQLNQFAELVCERQNSRICKATGMVPNLAFRSTANPYRRIDAAQFDAAFKGRDLSIRVAADVTISIDGVKYQLSRRDEFPFVELAAAKQKVEVYWLDEDEQFGLITPTGDKFIIEKVVAAADASGEFKALPETRQTRNRRLVKDSQKETIRAVKERRKANKDAEIDAPVFIVPGLDTAAFGEAAPQSEKVLEFPRTVVDGDAEKLDDLTFGLASERPAASRRLDSWAALEFLQSDFGVPEEPCAELDAAKQWLRELYDGKDLISEADISQAFCDARSEHLLQAAG